MYRIIITYKIFIQKCKTSARLKWTHGLSGNDNIVATLPKS